MSKFTTVYYYLDTYDTHGYFGFGTDVVSIPDVGELVYLQKNVRYSYFIVKERIFDARNNVVHIRVEKTEIENRNIRLRGHQ